MNGDALWGLVHLWGIGVCVYYGVKVVRLIRWADRKRKEEEQCERR
jgi:hypothetical protein